MSEYKFYIDTEGNDDNAYVEAMKKASEIAQADNSVKRVILLVNTKTNTGWFERILGAAAVKKLFTGIKITGFFPQYKLETKVTFKDHSTDSYVVITCGWDAGEVSKIDDYYSAKYIIAIPWSKNALDRWVKTWSAVELRGKAINHFSTVTCIVKTAFERLTTAVNLASGLTHPSDVELAKTYILALYTYEPTLDKDAICGYLISSLGWESDEVKLIKGYMDTLTNGKSLRGAKKGEIKYFYDQWKEACK